MYICVSSTFASAVLRSASCYAATAVMTTDKQRGKLLPRRFWISLPFPFASLFLVSNGTRSTDLLWVPSVNILYPAQFLTNGIDEKLVCPSCLKTDRAPPSSTHSCVSCNTPMYAWCGFCICSKQEPGGGCCSRVSAVLFGWKPIADHWECPAAIGSGSPANAVHFLQHRVECQAR